MDRNYVKTELAGKARALRGRTEQDAWPDILEVIASARALGVPTNLRRDDAPVFLAGTERIETATWTQCGGILFAVAHHEAPNAAAVAAQVAERVAELAPAHV